MLSLTQISIMIYRFHGFCNRYLNKFIGPTNTEQ